MIADPDQAPANPQARETHRRAFKGVWIDAEIWTSEELTWMEKCLIAEINSLDDGTGCYASNEYLANHFKTTVNNIKKTLSTLRTRGFLVDQIPSQNGVTQRRISMVHRYPGVTAPLPRSNGRVTQKYRQPPPSYIKEVPERNKLREGEASPPCTPANEKRKFTDLFMAEFQKAKNYAYTYVAGRDDKLIQERIVKSGFGFERASEIVTKAFAMLAEGTLKPFHAQSLDDIPKLCTNLGSLETYLKFPAAGGNNPPPAGEDWITKSMRIVEIQKQRKIEEAAEAIRLLPEALAFDEGKFLRTTGYHTNHSLKLAQIKRDYLAKNPTPQKTAAAPRPAPKAEPAYAGHEQESDEPPF